ncbi:Maf family nucleotide pyrophosphatase [Vaginella massiliensis]|uniref:Maf family nucleotide pyrophosphatase n=1 Tax=Vaginella massiliensis TaxID=1816680 RepID=UPI0037523673
MSTFPLPNLANYEIILASQSPRRRELLWLLDIPFRTISLDIDESFDRQQYKAGEITAFLAAKKANSFPDLKENQILITADTTVWLDDESLEKPSNEDEARNMLKKLSGKAHSVFTSVTLKSTEKEMSFTEETKVFFRTLSEEEIDFYIQQYQPFDKAGAYGIQEWIGLIGIEKIEGDYFTVMGLPTQAMYLHLKDFVK